VNRLSRVARTMVAVGGLALLTACAARVAPPLPATLAYPEFVYPGVPGALWSDAAAAGIDEGWRFLQAGDLAAAGRVFGSVGGAGFYPALAGQGWVALARGDYPAAEGAFDAALDSDPAYVPALVGLGQTQLAQGRDVEAVAAFDRAVAADPALGDLRRRADLLRVRVLQEVIETGRQARTAGRLDEARAAYLRALEASPATGFLYRELGAVEHARGALDAAFGRYRRRWRWTRPTSRRRSVWPRCSRASATTPRRSRPTLEHRRWARHRNWRRASRLACCAAWTRCYRRSSR